MSHILMHVLHSNYNVTMLPKNIIHCIYQFPGCADEIVGAGLPWCLQRSHRCPLLCRIPFHGRLGPLTLLLFSSSLERT
ncbi:hypothetical protein XENTR_v10015076 [Xenopus tropicalis]|nr:hypothetical protein XENTR_v10015076 [Xenopus tropicalis]